MRNLSCPGHPIADLLPLYGVLSAAIRIQLDIGGYKLAAPHIYFGIAQNCKISGKTPNVIRKLCLTF